MTVSGGGGTPRDGAATAANSSTSRTDNKIMAVPVRTTPSLQLGSPTALFTLPANATWMDFDVSPDGQKFLAIVPQANPGALPLTVIANWTALLHR